MYAQPRLLLVEDSADDCELLIRHLNRAGIKPQCERLDTLASIEVALDNEWDAIICDYHLPLFDALQVIALAKSIKNHLPIIVVSGSVGEEKAVETIKAGANDYILKNNLIRLVPILERTLKEAEHERERKTIEANLKKSEDNLRQAQKLESIGQLAGGIAHDFNNLLATILIQSEVLKGGLDSKLSKDQIIENAEKGIEQIIKSAGRATNLTRQLLAFSRKQVLQTQVLNLNTLITDMQNMLRRIIEENIEFKLQLASDLKNIKIDPGHLEQIVMNLIVNSRDAMPDGGRLKIETQNSWVDDVTAASCNVKPGPHILLTISDTGMGMTDEVKKHIFEPFFTTKPVGRGTGLGLSTVYGIVKQNNGLIFIDSEVGTGTCFKLYFPISDENPETRRATERAIQVVKGSETILVVEDEEDLRDLVCDTLKSNGYHVLMSSSGIDALAQIKSSKTPINLILTDVIMPQMGGPELAQHVQRLKPEIKFLFQSGYAQDALTQNGIDENQIHFIAKPFPLKVLLQKVRLVLGQDESKKDKT